MWTRSIIIEWLERLLALDVPSQFLHLTAIASLRSLCRDLELLEPYNLAGNAIIGNLKSAHCILAAHIDEASFNVIDADKTGAWLAACHRYLDPGQEVMIRFLGIRSDIVQTIGTAPLSRRDTTFYSSLRGENVRLGDRAVYCQPTRIQDDLVVGKAIDDRVGALIALCTAAELDRRGQDIAVVLTDGEQSLPDGYFSRNFPHILSSIKPESTIIFVDGIFQDGLEPVGFTGPPETALLVPHSGQGKGYSVPPILFAWLRDVIVPRAQHKNIGVHVSAAYHSRGDDWGMVTNPTAGHQHSAFFVSFGGWGRTPSQRTLHVASLENCVSFLTYAIPLLADEARPFGR